MNSLSIIFIKRHLSLEILNFVEMYQVYNEKPILWTRAHSDSPREKERFLSDKVFICCILCKVDIYFKEWIYSDIKKIEIGKGILVVEQYFFHFLL